MLQASHNLDARSAEKSREDSYGLSIDRAVSASSACYSCLEQRCQRIEPNVTRRGPRDPAHLTDSGLQHRSLAHASYQLWGNVYPTIRLQQICHQASVATKVGDSTVGG